MERDRLKRKLKQKTFQTTILFIVGFILVLFLVFNFGIKLLINFSLFLTHTNSKDAQTTTTTQNNISYVAPPNLDPISEATNSAQIIVTGSSSVQNGTVKLYVNDTLTDSTKSNDKNQFTFKNVNLEEGSNTIKAKTVTDNGKESDFSSPYTITYNNKPPTLTVDYPSDGQTFKDNQQTITGKTDPGATIQVNGFQAIVEPNGNFSYDIKLNNGGNDISFEAQDSAGNKTDKKIHVTLSQ